ncbi:hypothetical protein ADL25_44825 [Streptomyces sp. NRRL F-5122]|nr:hypothetical protein ADL25_44825 [Streptomyces sp. NRRL F-5122]
MQPGLMCTLYAAEFVGAEEVDAVLAGHRLDRLLLVCSFDQLTNFTARAYTTTGCPVLIARQAGLRVSGSRPR